MDFEALQRILSEHPELLEALGGAERSQLVEKQLAQADALRGQYKTPGAAAVGMGTQALSGLMHGLGIADQGNARDAYLKALASAKAKQAAGQPLTPEEAKVVTVPVPPEWFGG